MKGNKRRKWTAVVCINRESEKQIDYGLFLHKSLIKYQASRKIE